MSFILVGLLCTALAIILVSGLVGIRQLFTFLPVYHLVNIIDLVDSMIDSFVLFLARWIKSILMVILLVPISFVFISSIGEFIPSSTSSSSSSSVNQSQKGSYSYCTSKCGSNRDTCEAQGTSYEICKGGEGYCLTDCCVMYQSSDEYAAAMCR